MGDRELGGGAALESLVAEWMGSWRGRINAVGARYGYADIAMPALEFNLVGTDAAQAVVGGQFESVVRINAGLLRKFPERYRDEFIAHELSHVAADRWLGVGPDSHGYQWRWVMGQIGAAANAEHDLLKTRAERDQDGGTRR